MIAQTDAEKDSEASNPSLGLLGNLPVEVLLKILEYVADDDGDKRHLYRLRQVSKQLSELSLHPFLWKSLTWKTGEDGSSIPMDVLVKTLNQIAAQATKLEMSGITTCKLVFGDHVDNTVPDAAAADQSVAHGADVLEAAGYDSAVITRLQRIDPLFAREVANFARSVDGTAEEEHDEEQDWVRPSPENIKLLETVLKLHGQSLEKLSIQEDGTLLYSAKDGQIAKCFKTSLPVLKMLDLKLDDHIGHGKPTPKLKLPFLFKNLELNAPLLEDLRISVPLSTGGSPQAGLDKCVFTSVRSLVLSGQDMDDANFDGPVEIFRLPARLLAKAFPNVTDLALLGPWVPVSQEEDQPDADAIIELLSAFPNLETLKITLPGYNADPSESIDVRSETRRLFEILDPLTVPKKLAMIKFHGLLGRREFVDAGNQGSLRSTIDTWWLRRESMSEEEKSERVGLMLEFTGARVKSTGYADYEFDELAAEEDDESDDEDNDEEDEEASEDEE